MDTGTMTVILLLIANEFIALVTFIISFFSAEENRICLRIYALLFLVCPVVGVLCMAFYALFNLIFQKRDEDFLGLINSGERTDFLKEPDENVELNFVPIRDVLEMNDIGSMRQLLMNLTKTHTVLDSPKIVNAISSEDAETAHYAATMVTSFLSEFRASVQAKVGKLGLSSASTDDFVDVINYIYPVLESGIMNKLEYESYLNVYADVMEQLYQREKWRVEASDYLNITDLMVTEGNYEQARKWTMRAKENRPNELESYKCEMHLYYALKSREEFFSTLDSIKKIAIIG